MRFRKKPQRELQLVSRNAKMESGFVVLQGPGARPCGNFNSFIYVFKKK
jgi:hypothetical protein